MHCWTLLRHLCCILHREKACDSVVETANVADHAHGRVSRGRPRRRLETNEARVRWTVERDAADVQVAEQVSLSGVRPIKSITVTVAQTLLHDERNMQTRSDVVKNVVNV